MLHANFTLAGKRVLLELRLQDYAVIDQVAVEFAPGLNLMTGETGAGKSILVDALALLLGGKASSAVVRHGAERTVVAAVFVPGTADAKRVAAVLDAHGLDAAGELILRREIAGKGRVFVNNQPATVAVLRQLAPYLATVHSQSESLLSLDAAARLELLDAFAATRLEPTRAAFERWHGVRQRIADLERDEQDRLRLLDLWNFQQKEIEAVRPEAGEDERLEGEKRVLANAEKIYAAARSAGDDLYEGSESGAAAIRRAQKRVEELGRYDDRFRELAQALDSARISVEDAGITLRDYAAGVQASPERLAEVEDRLAALDRVKRKYGPALADVIAFAQEIGRKLAELENKDEVLAGLRGELAQAAQQYLAAAQEVSRTRQRAAERLQKKVEQETGELAMKAKFRIEVATAGQESAWTASGCDAVTFMISANPGEPLKPLEQIASGGELSRVLLALKAVIEGGTRPASSRSNFQGQRTLVFDEIDIGIGGRAAEAVGGKLKQLSRTAQVLCVTHLPQIASFADHHYLIEKREVGGRARTLVRRIEGQERKDEIARMLSGARLTEASRRNAEQMLKANA